MDLASRVARLTAGQRECLFFVDDHATSKEIARQLGISRHTVDARLRGAIQTLGVSSRREAAVIYRAAMQAEGYQPFAYQSPQIVTGPREAENPAYDDSSEQHKQGSDDCRDASVGVASAPVHLLASGPVPEGAGTIVSDSAVWTALPPGELAVRRPFLRLWGGANDLSPAQRVGGILVVTILAMLAFGVFLAGIEALTLLRS
ncbi:MAG: LuxR C-terminal-related transcriptional regulator [Sandaracinobacter sp.]